MAYQPKSYRKFVATAATATLVASAVAPAAAAGFTDVPARYKDAVDFVVSKGVNGLTETTFGTGEAIKRVDAAVMIAKVLELDTENAPAAGFTDVPARAQGAVNALKEAGITSGKTATSFDANSPITRGELAIWIQRGFDLKGSADLDFTDVSDRYAAAVEALVANEITQGTSATKFGVTQEAKRGDYAIFLFKAANPDPGVVEVSGVSAITTKSLKVTFSKSIDTTKATFEVKKGAVKVNSSNITWNEDKTEATIELAGKLTAGEYSVNVSGLAEEVLSGSVKVEDEKVAKIEVLSTEAPLVDADSDNNIDDLQVGYRVLNQYGEDITKTTSLTTSSANVSVNPTTGVVTIVGNYDTTTNKLATFTLIHAQSATTASTTVTAVAEAKVSEVSVKGIYNKDGKALTETSNLSNDLFYVELELKDQYGKVIDSASKMSEVLITESNSTVVDAAANATVIEVDGKKKVVVALSGSPVKGTNIITAIAKASGKSASYTVEVAESTRAYNVDVAAPALAVANEVTNIPVNVTDKDGNLITDLAVLKDGTRGVKVSVDGVDQTANLIVKDGAVYLPQTLTEGYSSIVIISNATQKVDTLTLQVRPAAKAVIVTGVKSDFSTTLKATNSKTISVANLVVEDQYGRVMTTAQINAWLDASASNKIVITEDETSSVVAISDTAADTDIAASGETVSVVAGSAKGNEKITVTLHDTNGPITSSAKEVTLRVTDGTEFVSYSMDEIGTVYDEGGASATDADAYDKAINVYGVLADGSKVKLDTTEYTVKSSLAALATDAADGTIDSENGGVSYSPTYATNPASDVKEETLTVTIGATGQEFVKTVTFSKVAPKVAAVKAVDTNDLDDAALTTVAYDVANAGDFTLADLATGSATGLNLVVTDQYGVKTLATATTAGIAFADGTAVGAPTLTIAPVKGSITITNNGLATATVDDASVVAGEEFNVTVTYAGGEKTTVKVVAE
jgi:hypothetical protein